MSRCLEILLSTQKKWKECTIGELATDVRYGTSKPSVDGGKYPYLRMNNLTNNGELDLTDLKYIDVSDDEKEKCVVRKGDILFNRTNSIDLVGKTTLFDLDEEMIIAGYIIRVRLNSQILPEILAQYMNSSALKKLLRKMAKGAVNQANIKAQELQSIKVYVPDLDLQNRFSNFIQQVDKSKFLCFHQKKIREIFKVSRKLIFLLKLVAERLNLTHFVYKMYCVVFVVF
ncbi:MAG: restriction endonuclease subunit S [Bulleidia sp.]|nr:restriction endonuclease subunit S [Bulleidia sp.]